MRKRILNNFPLKLLSIVVAMGLWWFVYLESHPILMDTRNVPVTYTHVPTDVAIVSKKKTIAVFLQGTRAVFDRVDASELTATVDLKGVRPGVRNLPVIVTNNSRATLARKNYTISVELMRLHSRRFPVRVEFTEEEAPDVSIMATPSPFEVTVFGTTKQTALVNRVAVVVDLKDRRRSFDEWATPEALDRDGNAISTVRVEPSKVKVRIYMAKTLVKKSVPIMIQYSEGSRQGGSMTPSALMVRGNQEAVSKVRYIRTRPVDSRKCAETENFPVELETPAGVKLDTTRAVFTCEAHNSVTLTVPVEAVETPAGMTAAFAPPIAEVTVFGPPGKIKSLRAHDVSATVYLASATEGEHTLTLNVKFRSEDESLRLEFRPTQVRATIAPKRAAR